MAHEFRRLLGPDLPVLIIAYDGGARPRPRLRRGDLQVGGDLYGLLQLQDRLQRVPSDPGAWAAAGRLACSTKLHNRLLRPLAAANDPPASLPLRQALRVIDRHVDDYIAEARMPT